LVLFIYFKIAGSGFNDSTLALQLDLRQPGRMRQSFSLCIFISVGFSSQVATLLELRQLVAAGPHLNVINLY
jgi:hypothetical protein